MSGDAPSRDLLLTLWTRHRRWLIPAIAGIFIVAAIAYQSANSKPATRLVSFRVTGSATKVNVTYPNVAGGYSVDDVSLPWAPDPLSWRPGSYVQVTAVDEGGGPIVCEILIDGKIVTSGHAETAGEFAACSATVS